VTRPPALGREALLAEPFHAALVHLFEERIPFNRTIGLAIVSIAADGAHGRIERRADLIGNDLHQRLHGGVISAGLDAIAGLACMAAIGARHPDETVEQRLHRFLRLGTIDLRVDYLRPALCARFALEGEVLRLGSRVASLRMAFRNEETGELLATGSAAYIVS
jgi:acyl-coenzyme A thioesterase PaaI-like protein